MFVLYGNRRINIQSLKEYKPEETLRNGKTSYSVELFYTNGEKETLHFFDKNTERDNFIEKLDLNVKE